MKKYSYNPVIIMMALVILFTTGGFPFTNSITNAQIVKSSELVSGELLSDSKILLSFTSTKV